LGSVSLFASSHETAKPGVEALSTNALWTDSLWVSKITGRTVHVSKVRRARFGREKNRTGSNDRGNQGGLLCACIQYLDVLL